MTEIEIKPQRSRWPLIIIGLLSVHVLVSLIFVYIATSNPSFAVEENYYQKALNWDEKRAQDANNLQLGWKCETSLIASTTAGEPSTVTVTILDSEGTPIDNAKVKLECFALARSGHILHAALASTDNGQYKASIDAHRPGLWEIRISAERQGKLFTFSERLTFTSALRVRARVPSTFRIPSAPHLRFELKREILNVARATPRISLNPSKQICGTSGRAKPEFTLARTLK